MTKSSDGDYPNLDGLMSSYFHQDYDILGGVDENVTYYARVHDPAEVWATIADIRRFLHQHATDAEETFERIFKPQVVIAPWNKTVKFS